MGSPAHYGVFGAAITHLVHNESPASLDPSNTDCEPFFCYTWVDDHVLAEEDRDDRLELCEAALRLAMLAILGPRSINEKKFTRWSTRLRALGLDWDTDLRSVLMPEEKIAKALLRVKRCCSTSQRRGHSCANYWDLYATCVRVSDQQNRCSNALHLSIGELLAGARLLFPKVLFSICSGFNTFYNKVDFAVFPSSSLEISLHRTSSYIWMPATLASVLSIQQNASIFAFSSTTKNAFSSDKEDCR
ncbi:hypothetical protein PPTG_20662 [Phytophthora nicotianae INRA-310]|uniref:Uncharacterized protein n=1 Tax=Phytophthora nicotianae (strain INRA-310) TaxID=761204 RepID=W2RE73_PHYN3|nr:hypothetical protein PPTG_20662 [Phytophthora nicotianae INRA-310]ETN23536.1 hypothetical protein PPTG_20662 [Phytophthora nicotianae INRA-310]